jgi:hypothetical protein
MRAETVYALFDELEKIAGKVDPRALAALQAQLRPGDVINFEAHRNDSIRKSLRGGAMTGAISTPIQSITGSPDNHTAIYHGVDPASGRMRIVHNYEQGGKNGTQFAYLDDFADTNSLHAYRPQNATPEMAQAAAARAGDIAAAGGTHYSKRNLVGAGVNQIAENPTVGKFPGFRGVLKRVAGAVGERCDPGTSICSALPVDAYQGSMGQEKALETFTGRPAAQIPDRFRALATTPGSIRSSPHMQAIGHYKPMNQETSALGAGFKRLAEKGLSPLKRIASKIM